MSRRLGQPLPETDIRDAIDEANEAVHRAMAAGIGRPAMGTTVVGMLLGGTTCTFFNVGDSRAYVLRERNLTRHSVDPTPARGKAIGLRSYALTQSLGGTLSRRRLDPHIEKLAVLPGDVIMLCSDGLTDLVGEADIATILLEPDPHPATALLTAALEAGGRNNVSVADFRV